MTDRQSSFVAAVAMAAVFSVGIAFGIALDHRVLHRRPPRIGFGEGARPRGPFLMPPVLPGPGRPPEPNVRGPSPDRAVDADARDLSLSSEQRTVADSILHPEFEAANAIREETWPRMQAVMDETRRRLDSLLTPVQRERYRAVLDEQEQRFRSRDSGRPAFPQHPR